MKRSQSQSGAALGPAAAELLAPVVVQLGARAARADRPGLPEVVAAEPQDPLGGHADLEPERDGLLVGRHVLVAAVDGRPQPVGVEAEALGRGDELPGLLDRERP